VARALEVSISERGIPVLAEGTRQKGNPVMFDAKQNLQVWPVLLVAAAMMVATPVTDGQSAPPVTARSSQSSNPQLNPEEVEPLAPSLPAKRKRDLLKYNFNQMKKDAQEVAKLAQSLQEDLEHSNENVLSLGVVSKAEKIEKLAKKIKENAKGLSDRAGGLPKTQSAAAR
jgi:hypothetical protein